MCDENKSDGIHLVQVDGKMAADAMADALESVGLDTDNNVIIIDHQVRPLDREQCLFFLEEMARTLDVADEMDIDWEEVYSDLDLTK